MPRDGQWLLSDLRWPKLAIVCDCGLARRYDRAKLLERAGDMTLRTLRYELARREGCTRPTDSHHPFENCRVCYRAPVEWSDWQMETGASELTPEGTPGRI